MLPCYSRTPGIKQSNYVTEHRVRGCDRIIWVVTGLGYVTGLGCVNGLEAVTGLGGGWVRVWNRVRGYNRVRV